MRKDSAVIIFLAVSVISLFTVGTFLSLVGPSLQIEWKQAYHTPTAGLGYPFGYSAEATSDGGFVIAGWVTLAARGDFWLQKVDANGNPQWNKVYGDENNSFALSVDQTSDGGYIMSGSTGVPNSLEHRILLVKVDQYGNEEWNKTYAGAGLLSGGSVYQTADGGYITLGSNGVSVIRTYSNGSIQWNRTYSSGAMEEYVHTMSRASDGGYVIIASVTLLLSEGTAFGTWLIKINQLGEPQWNRTFGGTEMYVNNWLGSVQQSSDGGYILTGTSNQSGIYAGTGRAWLLKLRSNGSTEWSKTFGAADWTSGMEVEQASDGGYIAAIYAPWILGHRVWLWKTDVDGATLWSKPLDSGFSVFFLHQTPDGDYALAGRSGDGSGDVLMMKVAGSPPLFAPELPGAMFVISFSLFVGFVIVALIRSRSKKRSTARAPRTSSPLEPKSTSSATHR